MKVELNFSETLMIENLINQRVKELKRLCVDFPDHETHWKEMIGHYEPLLQKFEKINER